MAEPLQIEIENIRKLDRMEAPYRYRIQTSILKRIRAWFKEAEGEPELLEGGNFILPPDYDILEAVHEFFIRSFIMGMEAALAPSKKNKNGFADTPLLSDAPISELPFERALSFAKTQIPLTKKDYYALDDRLRLRAFTVGRLNDADAVNNVKSIFRRNMEQGGSLSGFLEMTDDEILDGAGFGRGNGSYWETVYRTNQTAIYNAGRAKAFEEKPPIALEFIGIDDQRQTDICKALTVPPFIRPYGDPVWRDGKHYPPLHFGCRSTVRGIYDKAEIEEGGGEEKFYSGADRNVEPQKGFGAYPLDRESYWRLTPDMLKRARDFGIDGEIAAAAVQLGMPAYAHKIVRGGFETLFPVNGTPLAELPSGGYLRKAKTAKPSEREIELAKKAVEEGHKIFFMPETINAKSPDVVIDGHTAEIKHISGLGKETIENSIRRGRKQHSTIILMEVSPEYSQTEITRQVKTRLRRSEYLQIVLVSWKGKLLRYTK